MVSTDATNRDGGNRRIESIDKQIDTARPTTRVSSVVVDDAVKQSDEIKTGGSMPGVERRKDDEQAQNLHNQIASQRRQIHRLNTELKEIKELEAKEYNLLVDMMSTGSGGSKGAAERNSTRQQQEFCQIENAHAMGASSRGCGTDHDGIEQLKSELAKLKALEAKEYRLLKDIMKDESISSQARSEIIEATRRSSETTTSIVADVSKNEEAVNKADEDHPSLLALEQRNRDAIIEEKNSIIEDLTTQLNALKKEYTLQKEKHAQDMVNQKKEHDETAVRYLQIQLQSLQDEYSQLQETQMQDIENQQQESDRVIRDLRSQLKLMQNDSSNQQKDKSLQDKNIQQQEKDTIRDLRDQLASLREEYTSTQKQHRRQIEEKDATCQDLRMQLKTANDEYSQQKKSSDETAQDYNKEIRHLETELKLLREQYSEKEEMWSNDMESQKQQFEKFIDNSQAAWEAKEAKYHQTIHDEQKRCRKSEERMQLLQSKLKLMKDKYDEDLKQGEHARKDTNRSQKSVRGVTVNNSNADKKSENAEVKSKLQILQVKNSDMDKKLTQLSRHLEETTAEKELAYKENARKATEIVTLKARLDGLEEWNQSEDKSRYNEIEDLKTRVQSAQGESKRKDKEIEKLSEELNEMVAWAVKNKTTSEKE